MDDYPKRLKYCRKKRGFTQQQLQEKCCMAKNGQTISLFERGKRIPDLETAYLIAKALNVSLDWMTGLKGK